MEIFDNFVQRYIIFCENVMLFLKNVYLCNGITITYP